MNMSKYKYVSYDYSKIVESTVKINYSKDLLMQNVELRGNTLYITYYKGIDNIVVNFDITDLIGTENG